MTTKPSLTRLLKISGDDAQEFLQGQLTSDISKLDDTWQLTGYCNPKGRLLCTGFLWRADENFFLLLNAELLETIKTRLQMYVMRSKVILQECSNVVRIHANPEETESLSLDASASAIEHIFGSYSCALSQQTDPYTSLHTLHCTNHKIEVEVLDDSNASNTPSGLSVQDMCIKEGLALITPETAEKYVPQMVNLELIGGVSFKKGCYTGQEIVARMHYLGKLKQRLYRYSIKDSDESLDASISLGSKLVLAANTSDDQLNTSIGEIVSINSTKSHALVVARVAHAGEELQLLDHPSIKLIPATLPYAMD